MIISILFLIISSITPHIYSMNNKKPLASYNDCKCKSIHKAFKNETKDFIEMIYTKQLDPAQELKRINQQFTYYKNKTQEEKHASLLALKKFHNISDDHWQWCMETTKHISTLIKENINNDLPNAHHDPIADKNKLFLAQYLLQWGFNINKINIIHDNTTSSLIGMGSSCDTTTHIKNDKICISIKPTIMFFHNKPTTFSKGGLINIAWIFSHISCMTPGLIYAIKNVSDKNYTVEQIYQNNEFIHFEDVLNKQADILPSLDNCKTCKWIIKTRSQTQVISEDPYKHFQELCTIKYLWKKKEILEKLVT